MRRVVINLHHRADTIAGVVGDGAELGVEVRYSWETQVLGSAGGPARALPLLAADRFFIVNGDTLADVDLAALADAHAQSGAARHDGRRRRRTWRDTTPCWPTMADASSAWRHEARRRPAFRARPTPALRRACRRSNAAAFAAVAPTRPSEVLRGIYPALRARDPARSACCQPRASFYDIGTPADYLETALARRGRERRPLDRGPAVDIAPTAQVEDTVLWDRVTVGDRVRLTRCIVADDVVIPAGMQ